MKQISPYLFVFLIFLLVVLNTTAEQILASCTDRSVGLLPIQTGRGRGDPNVVLHISFSLSFQIPSLPRSGRFVVGDNNNKCNMSTKLMASLAPARSEVEAGVVAKADQ
jgi:hypothetical protein